MKLEELKRRVKEQNFINVLHYPRNDVDSVDRQNGCINHYVDTPEGCIVLTEDKEMRDGENVCALAHAFNFRPLKQIAMFPEKYENRKFSGIINPILLVRYYRRIKK